MRRTALLTLLMLAACGKSAPTGLAPHQIHIAGSSAGFPFTTLIAERLMREDADAIAPLVRAGGSSDGIARFCDGPGELHPDLVVASRTMTPAETRHCAADGVDHVGNIPLGFTAFVAVMAKASAALPLTRGTLSRALTSDARTWAEVDPSLPALAIKVQGPTPDPGIADGLYDRLLAPGAHIRRDGAYVGHGANAELVATVVATTPGAVGIVPYAQALAHADTLKMLSLDGVTPDVATIASGRYPASAPLILLTKPDEVTDTPALPSMLGYMADALAPGGAFEKHGLVSLSDSARANSIAQLRSLAKR